MYTIALAWLPYSFPDCSRLAAAVQVEVSRHLGRRPHCDGYLVESHHGNQVLAAEVHHVLDWLPSSLREP